MAPRALPLLFLAVLAACSSQVEARCNGTTCTCPADSMCEIDPVPCSPCAFECGAGSTCNGRCGGACSVSCQRESSCELGVGAGGSVTCAEGSECHLTCGLGCTLTCAPTAFCTLRCATDAAPRTITGTVSCP